MATYRAAPMRGWRPGVLFKGPTGNVGILTIPAAALPEGAWSGGRTSRPLRHTRHTQRYLYKKQPFRPKPERESQLGEREAGMPPPRGRSNQTETAQHRQPGG